MFYLLFFILFAFQPLLAQYGFNHPELEWQTIETDHFRVHYHNGAEWTARHVAEIAENIYDPVTKLYDFEPPEKTHLIIKDFNDYSNGAAYYYDNKIEIWSTPLDYLLRGNHPWLLDVVTHEFSHIISLGASMKFGYNIPAFYLQWIGYERERRKDVITGYPNQIISYPIPGVVIPPWLAEGMAQFMYPGATGDFWDSHRDMILRDRVLHDNLLSFEQMNSFGKTGIGNESVYNQGYALVRYIMHRYGKDSLEKLARELQRKERFSIGKAMKQVLGKSGDLIYEEWKNSMKKQYLSRLEKIQRNLSEFHLVEKEGTTAIFPSWIDTSSFYFLSNKGMDYFSVTSLYRFDMKTGDSEKIIPGVTSRVSQTGDGKILYYSKRSKPDKYGSIYQDVFKYDVESEKEEQVTHFRRAYQPTVSPDGAKLVFVHGEDGTHNLVLLDLKKNTERVLTDLPGGTQIFSPTWSHDGEKIAFDFMVDHGRDMAILDIYTGEMEIIDKRPCDTRDPVFGEKDRWLYYSSDESGIFNIYRRDIISGKVELLTNVTGGAFMPTLNSRDEMLFSLYDNGGYRIAKLDTISSIPPENALYDSEYMAHIPENPDLSGNKFNDSSPYKNQFARMFVMPKFMVDYHTVKPGFYFYSSEVLDKMSVFGGASVNKLLDKDIFLIFDYRKFKYTLTFEIYHISRKVDQSLDVYQAYPADNKYEFSLFEMVENLLIPLNRRHFLSLRLSQQKYRASVSQIIEGIQFPTIAYDYYRGFITSLVWDYKNLIPSFAMDSNPRFGLKTRTEFSGEINRFISELDFSRYSTLIPVYSNYDLFRIKHEGAWFSPLPLISGGAFNLEWRTGWMNKIKVDSFFNFFAGGLPGLRGYPYYSIEGRNLFTTRATLRVPVFTQKAIRILPFSFQNLFLGLYAEWGNAWDRTESWRMMTLKSSFRSNLGSFSKMVYSTFSDFKRDIGIQLRISGFSFYNYPTAISLDAVYGFDTVTFKEENRTIEYGREWRTYLTVLFGL